MTKDEACKWSKESSRQKIKANKDKEDSTSKLKNLQSLRKRSKDFWREPVVRDEPKTKDVWAWWKRRKDFKDKGVDEKEMTLSVQSQPHQRSQSMKEQDYSMTTIKVQDKDKERPNHVARNTVIFEWPPLRGRLLG